MSQKQIRPDLEDRIIDVQQLSNSDGMLSEEQQSLNDNIDSKSEKTVQMKALRNRFWVILTVLLNAIYLYWRFRYTLPLEYGIISLIIGVSLVLVEFMGAIESLVHYYNMHRIENHPVPQVSLDAFPEVDIYIATYMEPIDLLYKTINGCKYLEYPDKTKVHIHLCDDGRREEARQLASDLGIHYITRDDNKGAKAGNLNNAMRVTSAPLILTMDADMIPRHNLLMRLVPYFVDVELQNVNRSEKDKIKLGFVQTPQSFYNPDLFQFFLYSENRIPNEQDYFYKDVQVSRNRSNSVIYGGSNTLISRSAIEEVGGFYTEAITEDFATGILIQKKGYTCYAVNEVLASGLSATDLSSLIKQRIRWARGCIQTGRKLHVLLDRDLTVAQKVNYWASIWYWYAPIKRLIYIMAPIMFAAFGFIVIKTTLLEVLIFWLPMYISSNIALKMLSQNIRSTKWTNIYETTLFPFMLFPVLSEFFGITLKKFHVTKKERVVSDRSQTIIYALPFILFIFLSVIGIANCLVMIFQSGSMSPAVVLFWLLANLFSLVMALFFILGRNFYRTSERVVASVESRLHTRSNQVIYCTTKDFSESGIALFLDSVIHIDEKEVVMVELATDRYYAKLKATIAHVERIRGGWKYAFKIIDYYDTKNDYLQILYDRIPTMPLNLNKAHSSFDDVKTNISKRTKPAVYLNRKFPRVEMNELCNVGNDQVMHVVNFNFKYIVTDTPDLAESIQIHLDNGLILDCIYERTVQNDNKLYAVTNYDAIHSDAVLSKKLTSWLESTMHKVDENDQKPSGPDLVTDLLGGPTNQANDV